MSTFVESLKRLYNANPQRITLEKLGELLNAGKINQEEYAYIIGGD